MRSCHYLGMSMPPSMMPGAAMPHSAAPAAAPSDAIQAAMAATLGTIQLPSSTASPSPAATPASATPAKGIALYLLILICSHFFTLCQHNATLYFSASDSSVEMCAL